MSHGLASCRSCQVHSEHSRGIKHAHSIHVPVISYSVLLLVNRCCFVYGTVPWAVLWDYFVNRANVLQLAQGAMCSKGWSNNEKFYIYIMYKILS